MWHVAAAISSTIEEKPLSEPYEHEVTLAFIEEDLDDKSDGGLTEDEPCLDSKENEPPASLSDADADADEGGKW